VKVKKVLNETDVKKIIGKYFEVPSVFVTVNIKQTTEGYWQGEHTVNYVEVEVLETTEVKLD